MEHPWVFREAAPVDTAFAGDGTTDEQQVLVHYIPYTILPTLGLVIPCFYILLSIHVTMILITVVVVKASSASSAAKLAFGADAGSSVCNTCRSDWIWIVFVLLWLALDLLVRCG
jgi:hypothetical protein